MNEFEQNPVNPPMPPTFNQPQAPQNQAPDPISTFGRPMMSFMEAVKTCFIDKYCCFKGRARRSEFWWYYLAQQILCTIVGWIALGIYLKNNTMFDYINDPITFLKSPAMIIMGIFTLLIFIRWIVLLINKGRTSYESGWNQIDMLLNKMSYKIAGTFTKKTMSYQTSLLWSWIILLVSLGLGHFLILILVKLCYSMPF